MKYRMSLPILVVAAGLLAGCKSAPAAALAPAPASRGEYLVRIMDCAGCHTPGALTGKPDFTRNLAGSTVGFRLPGAGVFYPPNLTPDPDTGLGRWSEAQIARAVRHGERPDGRRLMPVMPWPSYSALTDADAAALAAYLKSLPPIRNAVPRPVADGQPAPAPYLDVRTPS